MSIHHKHHQHQLQVGHSGTLYDPGSFPFPIKPLPLTNCKRGTFGKNRLTHAEATNVLARHLVVVGKTTVFSEGFVKIFISWFLHLKKDIKCEKHGLHLPLKGRICTFLISLAPTTMKPIWPLCSFSLEHKSG